MRTIDVAVSRPYRVELGAGLLPTLGGYTRAQCPRAARAVLVSDSAVWPLCGQAALGALYAAELDASSFILPRGETSKTAGRLITLLNFLAERHVDRSDVLVALGGGVVGDLTGLAAAVYMRGMDYIQCPTTLLAAVDASVGGKTAVDLDAGKNLMGAFWQPRGVLCDTDALSTLPEELFADGCAEIIKTAVLFDPPLFALLSREGPGFDREEVIARCVAHKRDVVAEDERDRGRRALLNLGHTLGHAVESCSGYAVRHGSAVAIGLAAVCRASARAGLCGPSLPDEVCALLEKFGLPTRTDIPLDTLMDAMLSDKKRAGDYVSVVVPEGLGRCSLRPMDAGELRRFYEGGLSA